MTSPGDGNLSYTDDSVVARIAVEVPGQAATDINQLSTSTANLRTELEALARAEGDWIGYLQQVPQIAEQANQAYRSLITSMERISYIQREMGGMPNVGPGGTASTGGGYSTAAPQGYTDPFAGMTSGMRGGVPQNMASAQSYMSQMQAGNPQLFANMMAQRGINPASFGVAGSAVYPNVPGSDVGGTGGGQGQGAPPPASASPQPTQSARTAAGPPDPGQSGAPVGSDAPGDPSEPHPDAPGWQHASYALKNGARQALNELVAGGGRMGGAASVAQRAMSAGGSVMSKMGGGSGGGGTLAKIGAGMGIAGAGVGAAAGLLNRVDRVGQEVTRYSQLGSVQGGGFMEGAGYEMQARMRGLMDPMISTEGQRQMMQLGLSAGFRGDDLETSQKFMSKNFKDLGMTFEQSSKMLRAAMETTSVSGKSMSEVAKDSQESLNEMKGLSRKGGAALPTRTAQLSSAIESFGEMGVSPEAASAASINMQESFPNNRVLREQGGDMMEGAYGDPRFALMVGQQYGITGLPEDIPGMLEERGINMSEAYKKFLMPYAKSARSPGMFMRTANAMGANLSYKQALNLYKEAKGGKDPNETARKSIAEGGKGTMGEEVGPELSAAAGGLAEQIFPAARLVDAGQKAMSGDLLGAAGEALNPFPIVSGAMDALGGLFDDDKTPSAPPRKGSTGATPVPLASPATQGSQGTVSGEVRITVDQAGRVSAPQTIQLTGQQRSVNAGYGGSTLNGPSAGDPSYNHAYSNWSGG